MTAIALVWAVAGSSWAAPVALVNPNFEADLTADPA